MKQNAWNDKENASFSALLADALEKASRAARVERATRWGAFALGGGGVCVCASVAGFEQDATTTCVCVAIVLLTAFCVAVLSAVKPILRARGRRAAALLAARRLERRFPAQTGVFVAAVDFCEEETGGPLEKTGTTSAVLRAATVEAARRGVAEIATTLDEAEFFAVLTETKPERFRKIGKIRRLFALGVLINVAVCGSAVNWGEKRRGNQPNVVALAPEKTNASICLKENKQNTENKEKEENKQGAETKKVDENKTFQEAFGGTEEAASLLMWELLISELAQNAEIAETLEAELKRAVDEERQADGSETPSSAAPTFLFLARELSANLSRPETGLIAQTRRLSASAERERQKFEARWGKIGGLDALRESEENRGIEEIGETGENVVELARSPGRTTGKEVALFWGAARLAKLETKLTAEGSVGDGTALELSRALRSDSSAERKKILTEASARAADWAKTLRREETAARILSESWRFDAAAQRRTTLVKRAERENRALLARFAGRLNVDFNASFENDELEEGKRRFDALWREANAAEKECVAIVDRLRERLQSESAQDFIEFVGNVGLFLNDWSFEDVEADETTARAIDEMTSQNETRRKEIAKNVENNRFGRAAERLKSVVASLEKETAFIFDESGTEVNVDNKNVVALEEIRAAEEIENVDWPNPRRFSALAALLTWGVDEKRTRKIELQTTEKEDVALASTETESVLMKKDARTAEGNDGEKTSSKEKGNEDGSLSQKRGNGEEKESKEEEKKAASDEVSVEKISGSNVRLGEDLGTVGGASGEELKNENGANAAGRVGGEGKNEEKNIAEILENKAFNAELPFEARRRFEETDAPEILPEYEEKIRRYRRRILEERR